MIKLLSCLIRNAEALRFAHGADDALFGTDFASNKPGKDKFRRIRDIDGKGS